MIQATTNNNNDQNTDKAIAKFKGFQVVRIQFGRPHFDSINEFDRKQRIISITTRSCELLPDSIKDIANKVKDKISKNLDSIEHWWINIETKDNYYIIQFRGNLNLIEIRKCKSKHECDQNGLGEACKTMDEKVSTIDDYSYPFGFQSVKTMENLIEWLKSDGFSPKYHLINNNCQDLCRAIYKWCG